MEKEQEAIEYLKKQMNICLENAEICDDNNFDEEAIYLREESYMLETLLNMLKEKDEEIENIRYIKNSFDYVVQKESEKKDKMIDLMAEKIFQEGIVWDNKEEVKQYFKSKAEKE